MQCRATLAAQHFAVRGLLIMLAVPLDGGSPPIPTARFETETALLLAPLWSLKPAPLCFRSVSGLAPSVPFQWFWRHFLLVFDLASLVLFQWEVRLLQSPAGSGVR